MSHLTLVDELHAAEMRYCDLQRRQREHIVAGDMKAALAMEPALNDACDALIGIADRMVETGTKGGGHDS